MVEAGTCDEEEDEEEKRGRRRRRGPVLPALSSSEVISGSLYPHPHLWSAPQLVVKVPSQAFRFQFVEDGDGGWGGRKSSSKHRQKTLSSFQDGAGVCPLSAIRGLLHHHLGKEFPSSPDHLVCSYFPLTPCDFVQ
jgi:hypothetical protein